MDARIPPTWLMLLLTLTMVACVGERRLVWLDAFPAEAGQSGIPGAGGEEPCAPACEGKECGPDGCGGDCGVCLGLGGGIADSLCASDGTCCKPSCEGKECGLDGCGGPCGDCYNLLGELDNTLCAPDGTCCEASCNGKECGLDGCGGSCGTCGPGSDCLDGTCGSQNDCGDITSQGKCEGTVLVWCEDGALEDIDCTSLGDSYVCKFQDDEKGFNCVEESTCKPSCVGKDCGDDGCGGSCGQCVGLPNHICANGVCECAPTCEGKECGDDGCGGSCGQCVGLPNHICVDGVCECSPNCEGKVCGADGCGGTCGSCPGSVDCIDGVCAVQTCDGWTCPPATYDADDGCHCGCGCWDPDCDYPSQAVQDCPEGAGCVWPGTCGAPGKKMLCEPCGFNSDCNGGSCLHYPSAPELKFCGQDCSVTPCPPEFSCHEQTASGDPLFQCAPKSSDCDNL